MELNSVIAGEGLSHCLDVSEETVFTAFHDAKRYGIHACDCLEFTFEDTVEVEDTSWMEDGSCDLYNKRICEMLLA